MCVNNNKKRKTILNIKCSNKRKCFITVVRLFKTRLCTYDRGINTLKKEKYYFKSMILLYME